MPFNYDWWFGPLRLEQATEARRRCALAHFPGLRPDLAEGDPNFRAFFDGLEVRTILYLRDGFSYEVKDLIPRSNTVSLMFECMPADEAYRVGAFIVTVPFEDVVRVEMYAVHPDEKPDDAPSIKGFAGAQPPLGRMDERMRVRDPRERESPMDDARI